jgi:hypothetical protein
VVLDPKLLPAPDFAAMSGDEIAAAIRELEQGLLEIQEQLRADLRLDGGSGRGEPWRRAAGRAAAFERHHLRLARAEAEKRATGERLTWQDAHMLRLEAQRVLSEQRERERVATAEAHLAEVEADAAWQRRHARRCRMFVVAADHVLTDAEWDRVWARAKEMFPDAPEWAKDGGAPSAP